MLYFIIIFLTMLFVEMATVYCSLVHNTMSLTYAILAPFFVNFYVLILLGLITLFLRFCIPWKIWDYKKKIFKVGKSEIKLYNKLKIKSWKEKVPEMGWTGGFPKNEIKSLETDYLHKFLQENCFAGFMHTAVGILGFTALFFLSTQDYFFAFPILIMNLILNLLPCFIQRYNRVRLIRIYESRLEKEKACNVNKILTKELQNG